MDWNKLVASATEGMFHGFTQAFDGLPWKGCRKGEI